MSRKVSDSGNPRTSTASLLISDLRPLTSDFCSVLHVHAGNIYGGVETMLLTHVRQRSLCPGLATSFALCFDGRLSEELTAAGAAVHSLGNVRIRQPFSVHQARRNLRKLLQDKPFDVVVTHSCWSQAVFGATVRAAGVPLVFYLHSAGDGRHWLERWARRTEPDMVIANSNFSAASASQIYAGLRAATVYSPVAHAKLNQLTANRSETRSEFQTSPDATVIIQVSRMEGWKGHALHLEALGLLKDLPDWVCWQVGGAQLPTETQYLDELKRTAARLGIAERVRFLDQRSDVARLMAGADIFCQPNLAPEPFGIVFIEALYAQLPVVTTSIGGAREIVNDSCGVLVPPGDAPSLAAALRKLIENKTERDRLGSAGPSRASELCDPAAQLMQFHQALSLVIRERQGR